MWSEPQKAKTKKDQLNKNWIKKAPFLTPLTLKKKFKNYLTECKLTKELHQNVDILAVLYKS